MLPLKTEQGKVIDYGTFPAPLSSMEHIDLCYLVTERKLFNSDPDNWNGEKYVATCINVNTDGYGDSPETAITDMTNNVHEYLKLLLDHYHGSLRTLKKAIEPDTSNFDVDDLWDIYHSITQTRAPTVTELKRYAKSSSERNTVMAHV